jgi:hypothetical protein
MCFIRNQNFNFCLALIVLLFCAGCKPAVQSNFCNTRDFNLDSISGKSFDERSSIAFDEKLNPKQLQADFAVFRASLEDVNPNLYRYRSKASMDSLFERQACQLADSIGYLEFLRLIARSLNAMACGHSTWNHNPHFYDFRDSNMVFFPFKLKCLDDKLFIDQNWSLDRSVASGTEVLSINNQPSELLLKTLRAHMYKDGYSVPFAEDGISTYFSNAYSNFVDNPQHFELALKTETGKHKHRIIALKKTAIDSLKKLRYAPAKEMGIPLRLSIDGSSASYTIKWFRNEYIEAKGQNFNRFTDSVFTVLKAHNISDLTIDLRDNHGGWTANGKELFSYFIEEKQAYINKVEFLKIDSFAFAKLILSAPEITDSMNFKVNEAGRLEWTNYPSLLVHPAAADKRFTGDVTILINEGTLSAAAIFSSRMRLLSDSITFHGQENAAAMGGQGGMIMRFQLPYTGIIIQTSTAKYSIETGNLDPKRGVIPNLESLP